MSMVRRGISGTRPCTLYRNPSANNIRRSAISGVVSFRGSRLICSDTWREDAVMRGTASCGSCSTISDQSQMEPILDDPSSRAAVVLTGDRPFSPKPPCRPKQVTELVLNPFGEFRGCCPVQVLGLPTGGWAATRLLRKPDGRLGLAGWVSARGWELAVSRADDEIRIVGGRGSTGLVRWRVVLMGGRCRW
jgi:hypothetical protein